MLMRLGRAWRFCSVESFRTPLAQLNGIGEQVQDQAITTTAQRIGELVHLTLQNKAAVGTH